MYQQVSSIHQSFTQRTQGETDFPWGTNRFSWRPEAWQKKFWKVAKCTVLINDADLFLKIIYFQHFKTSCRKYFSFGVGNRFPWGTDFPGGLRKVPPPLLYNHALLCSRTMLNCALEPCLTVLQNHALLCSRTMFNCALEPCFTVLQNHALFHHQNYILTVLWEMLLLKINSNVQAIV